MARRQELTPRQRAFVGEYLKDLNATQAAVRAGYSAKNADKIGPQLLGNSRVQAAIQAALKRREKRTEITQDRVLQELAKLAYSNMRSFAKWNDDRVNLTDSEALSDDEAACVSEISQVVNLHGNNVKVKLHDKGKALELLGKHLGLFDDRLNITGNLVIDVKLPDGLAPRAARDEQPEQAS